MEKSSFKLNFRQCVGLADAQYRDTSYCWYYFYQITDICITIEYWRLRLVALCCDYRWSGHLSGCDTTQHRSQQFSCWLSNICIVQHHHQYIGHHSSGWTRENYFNTSFSVRAMRVLKPRIVFHLLFTNWAKLSKNNTFWGQMVTDARNWAKKNIRDKRGTNGHTHNLALYTRMTEGGS